MNSSEVKRLLKEKGYRYLREARHGELWAKGSIRIMVQRTFEHRAWANLKADLRRWERYNRSKMH